MLNKGKLEIVKMCNCNLLCKSCHIGGSTANVYECIGVIADTALHLLERVETAKTILNDILLSGNVKSCEREIREFLEG